MARAPAFDPPHADDFRTLVEGVPAILYLDRPDEASTNLYTSPQVVELLGFSVDEWREDADLWTRHLHDDDRERVLAAHRRSNERGERFLEEYRFRTNDGREVWIRDEAVPVRGDDGTVRYWRGVMLDITDRKEAEEQLRLSLEVLRRTVQQRRELAARLETAQEEERRRIAADIHDDPIQVMSAVDMRLQLLAQDPAHVSAGDLDALERDVRVAIDRLRNLLFELRPVGLEHEGIASALRRYVGHVGREAGWEVQVRDGLDAEPAIDARILLYRIAHEAIANARKHASATHVVVELATAGDGVTMRVADDGAGFDPGRLAEPEPGHIGLPTIVERAELAGGWARVRSTPELGTTIECWIPAGAGPSHAPG